MSTTPTDPTVPALQGSDPEYINELAATVVVSLDALVEARAKAEARGLWALSSNLDSNIASLEATGRLIQRIAAEHGLSIE